MPDTEKQRGSSGETERFAFVCPGGEEGRSVVEEVRSGGAALQRVRQAPALDPKALAGIRAVAVAAGERVGYRGASQGDGIRVIPGKGLRVSETGECRATRYGYLCLEDDRLSVLSPVWVDPQGMEVYWLLLDERSQPVTREMIFQCLADQGVVEGIEGALVEKIAAQLREGRHPKGAVLIAAGALPEDGDDAQVEFLVDHERLAGREREDGSIDFREVNFATNVRAGQVVARRTKATPGHPGKTVHGEPLAALDGRDQRLEPGEQVEVREEDGGELFVATATGVFAEQDGIISVVQRLHIQESVDFRTGNLDFDGELCIGGSVVQGFTVKATSHVTVAGTVEAGTTVEAGGDLTVGQGIVGAKTRATAKGTVRAQFVQEATVAAGEDIVLGNFAYQARLRAGGSIEIHRGKGPRQGSVIGGQLWAHADIEVGTAGSPGQAPTSLMAGVDQENVVKLDRLRTAADGAYNQIKRLKEQFGLAQLDVGQIKNRIAAATGARQKVLANKAKQLVQRVKVYQKVKTARQQLEQQVGAQVENASIRIHGQAFPGVEIRLGEHRRRLTEIVEASYFRIVNDELVDR